jgi:hypothetical protein
VETSPVWLVGIVFCCASAAVAAQTPQKYSVERKVKFEPGNLQMTQGLKNVESIREIVASGYMIAAEDLNDDKYPEIIVLASSSNLRYGWLQHGGTSQHRPRSLREAG